MEEFIINRSMSDHIWYEYSPMAVKPWKDTELYNFISYSNFQTLS